MKKNDKKNIERDWKAACQTARDSVMSSVLVAALVARGFSRMRVIAARAGRARREARHRGRGAAAGRALIVRGEYGQAHA
jgi:hypothetical protein